MPSRILVLVLFALWSLISWRWYVCVIKERCGPEIATATTESPAADVLPDEQSTSGIEDTSGDTPPAVAAPLPYAQESELSSPPENLDRVQIEELEEKVIIHFPYNSTRREDNEAIDQYLSRLAGHLNTTNGKITITGHTDMVGNAKSNMSIGLQRAQHIRDILLSKGVRKDQIICRSKGESKPVATNDTPQGRYQNRRVEIE